MYEYASSVHIIEKISRNENVEDGASASLGDAASDILTKSVTVTPLGHRKSVTVTNCYCKQR